MIHCIVLALKYGFVLLGFIVGVLTVLFSLSAPVYFVGEWMNRKFGTAAAVLSALFLASMEVGTLAAILQCFGVF